MFVRGAGIHLHTPLESMGRKRILLISMPWASVVLPSIQIVTLQEFLRQHRFSSDVKSLYIPFADKIGFNKYVDCSGKHFIGDAAFAVNFYPHLKNKALSLIRKYTDKRFNYSNLFHQTYLFLEETMRAIDFSQYEYVGFSVVFNQLYASLALARKIKTAFPNVKIIFGGDSCCGEKGRSLMGVYTDIDYVISYEGEYPLLHLIEGQPPQNIPGLTYRSNNKIIANPPGNKIACIDKLTLPDFTEYFDRVNETKYLKNIKQFPESITIPVEITRGCWWNKCTFCSLNVQHHGYRVKSNAKIISEVKKQTRKYQINKVYFVSNNISPYKTRGLFVSLKPYNLEIQLYYSARLHDFDLLRQMKESGVTQLQFGLESLSKTLLEKKIKKGVQLINNIQMMKFLKELNIESDSNLIPGYPNETKKEFNETIKNFKYLYHLETPNLSNFSLHYRSPIFGNPEKFNIKRVFLRPVYENFIPKDILKKLILNCYDFEPKIKLKHPRGILSREVNRWIDIFVNDSTYPLLYYIIKSDCVIITDRRRKYPSYYRLDKDKSEIYLFCHCARNLVEIYQKFPLLTKGRIKDILNYLVKKRLIFRDGKDYISLAIDWERHKKYLLKDGIKRHKFVYGRRINICS